MPASLASSALVPTLCPSLRPPEPPELAGLPAPVGRLASQRVRESENPRDRALLLLEEVEPVPQVWRNDAKD